MDKDLDVANMQAMETIEQLARGDLSALKTAPVSSFWDTDKNNSRYSPSSDRGATVPLANPSYVSPVVIPRTYFASGSSRYYNGEAFSGPDAMHRKVMAAVYKVETQPQKPQQRKKKQRMQVERQNPEFSLSMANYGPVKPKVTTSVVREARKVPITLPQGAKDQMVAVVLTGLTKILTALAVGWARDKRVPLELL